ncbi:MAG: hypothetical protein ABI373_06690 [Flavobacteriales bacterium]
MSNLPHDHVHRLIHSMTRAEKRYFKLYITRHASSGEGNHGILFDAIARMESYDEAALRQQYAGKGFMRRFSITKRRLYEALLNSLDAFHAESSVDAKLQRSLHHVEILDQRALHADAAKVLRSVRTIARHHDRQLVLLQVAEWERRLMERSNYAQVSHSDLLDRKAQVAGVIREWEEVDQLWQVKSQSFRMLFRNGQAITGPEKAVLAELRSHGLLADDVLLLTARARFLHHHVRSALAYASNDLSGCERELALNMELLRDEQDRFKDDPDLLLGVMGNLAHVRMRLGKHREAVEGFQAFRRIPLLMATAPSADLEMKLFILGSSLKLSLHTASGEFDKAMEVVGEVEKGFEHFGEPTSLIRRSDLFTQIAYACFGAERYDLSLRWCNRVLNEKGIEEHTEMHALARILDLMTLMELGKTDLLPYTLRNMQRSLRTQDSPHGLLTIMLKFCRERVQQSEQARPQFQELVDQLEAMSEQTSGVAALDQVDLLSWALAKSQGRSFGAVVRERGANRAIKPTRGSDGPLKAA